MKRLWLFGGLCGLLLGSAAPPPAGPVATAAREPDRTEAAWADVATPFDADAQAAADAVPAPAEPPVAPPAAAAAPGAAMPHAEAPASMGRHVQEHAPNRRVQVVISLPQQKAYVFRGGRLFATSPVSTGRRGRETPAGRFRILQKKVRHRSNRYDDAPMPYMQRLTWYGIALHAGRLPGYPASHGCIRLPRKFARKLYGITDFSTEVIVTHARPKSAAAALAIA